jgi:hypothetical protein
MFKLLTALSLVALLFAGCNSLQSAPGAIPPSDEASPTEALSVPTVHLEAFGSSVQGLEIVSSWTDPNGLGGGGAAPLANPPTFPGVLDLHAGQSIEIVVIADSPVPTLVVTELDILGVPTASSVLKPTSSTTPYSPKSVGHFVLQVTVQQSWQQLVTYLFEVNATL